MQGRSKDYQILRETERSGNKARDLVCAGCRSTASGGQKKRSYRIPQLQNVSRKKRYLPRLIHLALLNVFENPKAAWDYLTAAYNKDPENPEIHSYRAKLLETVGKNNLALV